MSTCEISSGCPIQEAVPCLGTVFAYFYATSTCADHLPDPNPAYNITVQSKFLMCWLDVSSVV